MSNGYIGLTPDSSGKKLRTRKVTEDGNETHDEVVRLSNTTDTTINPATEDGNLATIAGKDFATQTTLALIKAKTDNLDTALSSNLTQYKCADIADSSDPNYYGFIDKDGNWYILQNNLANNTFRYIKGVSGYTTNWTNRAGLTYDYFNNIF